MKNRKWRIENEEWSPENAQENNVELIIKSLSSFVSNLLSLVFCLFISNTSFSQFKFDFKDSIPVTFSGNQLKYPWAGGLNYAQFSEIDFDFDGDMDLFMFDRSRDNIRLLEQVNENGVKKYKSKPNAKSFFPSDLSYRVALIDYNLDGKNDIFTYGIGGVKVYKNTGNLLNGLTWELVTDLLYSDYDGSFNNLYISSSDIPSYVDLDFDGDIDILTFEISGERVEYHQNQSQELYGHSDSLIFVLRNKCWGKFTEDAITSEIVLNANTIECGLGNVPNSQRNTNLSYDKNSENTTRHAGSTILAIDYDNSGVYDLILGDVNLANLVLLLNGGNEPNTNSAFVSADLNFPSNTIPANVSIFPAAFYIDVDFDNKKDLLVTPSAKGISQNEKSVYFYKNLGTTENPVFSFQSQNFFQNEMIEVGTASVPIFVDQNNDGLEDLFVANFFRFKEPLSKESNITNYLNLGTNSAPEFAFIESDFKNLSSQSLGLKFIPTFGDIDADGDKDMFLGLDNGKLNFYENLAGSGNTFNFSNPITNFKDNTGNVISTNNFCFPQLFDLNEDGKLDLILGKKTGEIMYYENVGTINSPSFELKNDFLGGIDVATTSPDGYAAPHFFKFQDTIRLLLGSFDGKLRFYDNVQGNIEAGKIFNLISSSFLGIDVEAYSSCWVNDIDNDGNLDLFVGGDLGGVFHLEHDDNSSLSITKHEKMKAKIRVFPNPSSGKIFIEWNSNLSLNSEIMLLNLLGEQVYFQPHLVSELDISALACGIYYLKVNSLEQIVVKIVKN
jgi:hypothetical protein